jgi:hypothetical protein
MEIHYYYMGVEVVLKNSIREEIEQSRMTIEQSIIIN